MILNVIRIAEACVYVTTTIIELSGSEFSQMRLDQSTGWNPTWSTQNVLLFNKSHPLNCLPGKISQLPFELGSHYNSLHARFNSSSTISGLLLSQIVLLLIITNTIAPIVLLLLITNTIRGKEMINCQHPPW